LFVPTSSSPIAVVASTRNQISPVFSFITNQV
jgi:hypothetical protein